MKTTCALRKTGCRSSLFAVFISSFILLPSAFPQGSLIPPGAPVPTMKTLDQVEPRTPVDAADTTTTPNPWGELSY